MLKNSSDEGNMIDNSEQTIHKQENTNFARIELYPTRRWMGRITECRSKSKKARYFKKRFNYFTEYLVSVDTYCS